MMMMILGMNFDLVSLRTNQSDEAPCEGAPPVITFDVKHISTCILNIQAMPN
jgi:hypothetical protein